MKKLTLLPIILAALAIAACSKKEHEVSTNNQPTQGITKTEEITYNTIIGTPMTFYWYAWWRDPNTLDPCQKEVVTDSLCYIIIGCGEGELPMAADLSLSIPDNLLKRVRIRNYQMLPTELSTWFDNRILDGHIVILHDCPIVDESLLSICAQEYIPAGTYSIFNDNGDAVIIL